LGETKGGVVLAVLVSLLAMVHKTFLEQLHAQSFIFAGHKLQQDAIFLFDIFYKYQFITQHPSCISSS